MQITLIIIFSYLLGSIPFGFLFTKFLLKKDIRKIGSGNIGATNVLRTGNKSIGYATLILDILKAVAPLIFVKIYYNEYLYVSSLCIFLGHVFPIWLKFKGGKGVATYVGILCCINLYLGICFGIIWLIIFFIFKYSSLSSLIGSLSVPIINFFLLKEEVVFFFIIMFILIFYTHRENIKRLLNHTESKTKIY
jgi:glycerol-3-phosphate acyltransferase PlsY